MTKHRPISIFALQTEEERARTELLSEVLEQCGPNERRLAYERAGLPSPEAADQIPAGESGKSEKLPNEATGVRAWIERHKQAVACLAVAAVLAVGIPIGYSIGWTGGSDAATEAAEQAAAEREAAAEEALPDLAKREANVKARYKDLGIDMKSMDRVSAKETKAVNVDKVKVKPTTELQRIADVDISKGVKVKLDVPLVNQLDDSKGGRVLMSGCEVASLAMILQNAGVKVTKEKLQDACPTVPLVDDKGLHGNPNKAFVGAMEGSPDGGVGYSVYHAPITALAQDYLLNRSFKVVDLTGCSFTVLLKEIASGNPAWVITTTTMQPDLIAEEWETPDGPKTVNWALHCVVLTGFDDKHVFINDPYGYDKNVPYDRNGFEQAWKLMGSQAVVVVPTD